MGERPDGQPKQDERVVVAGGPVQVDFVAAGAAVHEHPFPASAHRDADRFHERAAVGRPVAGCVVVDVPAPQAVRAVVPVRGARRLLGHVQPAVAATERSGLSAPPVAALIERHERPPLGHGGTCRRALEVLERSGDAEPTGVRARRDDHRGSDHRSPSFPAVEPPRLGGEPSNRSIGPGPRQCPASAWIPQKASGGPGRRDGCVSGRSRRPRRDDRSSRRSEKSPTHRVTPT